jgi:hypothetical protein
MKRTLLTGLLIFLISSSFAQTTYYWVGGTTAITGGASGGWNAGGNWNTMLDGSGSSRPASLNTDILIFDGSNIGGTVPTTGPITVDATSNDFGRLQIINNANVTVNRSISGTTGLNLFGDGDAGTTDFIVGAGSFFNFSGGFAVTLVPAATATGHVFGSITFSGAGHRISVPANVAKSILFKSGGSFTSGAGQTGAPFGNTAGTNAPTNDNVNFESGSSYTYIAGSNPFVFTSPASLVEFQFGSNFIVSSSSAISFSGRSFGNLIISSGSQTTTGAALRIGTFQINSGATFSNNSTSAYPIHGDLIVNGTLTLTGPATMLFCGNGTQTISGSGTLGGFNRLLVGSASNLVLARNVTITPSSAQTTGINGTLNLGTFTITGNSNSTFSVRNASSINVTGDITANSNTILVTSGTGYSIGQSISGPGILPNTYITSTGAPNIVMSQPATATTAGAAILATNTNGAVTTANTGGLDAGILSFSSISLNSGSSYTFKAATATPFPTSLASISINNLTTEAPVTTNKIITVNGTLTLTSGNLTIRPLDSIRVVSGNAVGGAPFSSSKYIITQVNTGTGDLGVLRMNNLSSAALFPVGSSTNYLPVTVTPTTTSDFSATAFEGITTDGTPNGTPFTPTEKQNVVDAVWNVTRINGTGDATLTTSWPQSLEGSNFTTLANIGIMHNESGIWGPVTGSGDNTANTATATFNSFSPFAVTANLGLLPMNWKNVSASIINGKVKIDWTTLNESAVNKYEVERSLNGRNFETIGSVNARNSFENVYSFNDANPSALNYYRIKSVSRDGEIKYSTILKINIGKSGMQLYPNPANDVLSITGLPSKSIIRIVNMAGATLQQLQPEQNTTLVTIPVNLLPKGSYFIQVTNGDDVQTKLFQKQ